MEPDKTYFVVGMSDEDYYVLLTLCRNLKMSKEALIMEALKTYIEKLQREWREQQKARAEGGEM